MPGAVFIPPFGKIFGIGKKKSGKFPAKGLFFPDFLWHRAPAYVTMKTYEFQLTDV